MKAEDQLWDANLYTTKYAFVFGYGSSLIELLDPQPEERILDLGCGTGELTALIAEKAKAVTGIDKSPQMIEKARDTYPEVQFEVADATDFRFSEKYNAIFSNAALHWVLDYKEAINCMYNALLPGGRLVLEMGGKGNVAAIVSALKQALAKQGYEQQANYKQWFFPSIATYTTALEEAGFDVRFSQLYDRPTELADEATGIKDWLAMFGGNFFKGVTKNDIEAIKEEVQQVLKPKLFKDGKWVADYKRLRVIAYKSV